MSLLHDNRRSSKTGYSLQISLLLELDNSLIIDGGVFYKECITFNSYAQSLTSTFMLLFHKLTQLLLQSSHSHYNTILYTQWQTEVNRHSVIYHRRTKIGAAELNSWWQVFVLPPNHQLSSSQQWAGTCMMGYALLWEEVISKPEKAKKETN